ncbi:phenylacetate-CoA oxygenase subunit PaaJ [Streptomyces sp. ACA25]|nr:1,2-phenylacetyl-CoA epoxidase subunit PaaD [Streptomyces sp. ACA25]MDB1086319.1 phenylacetate-CoA oxygenase subunit PaaJ [Streptomyces sp. ACA25]
MREVAGAVPDPELPVISLADLGVLRDVRLLPPRTDQVSEVAGPAEVAEVAEVDLTPTYTGCPAVETMATDIESALRAAGVAEVTVRTVLSPAWSTDDITEQGRRKLAEAGIAPPRPTGRPTAAGPVPLELGPPRHAPAEPVRCPQCGSADTTLLSRFSGTACKALRRCESCREPFDHVKEL